ncbi:DUF2397 family protein [Streptomyces sp. CLV115]|uniref:DUF2397 family protein n=1 Tax=Streptomyces sp. CLV115 TaxID=3138502 RepID=UPI00313E73B0
MAHGTTARAGAARHQVEVTLREHERHGPATGRPRKVPDTTAVRAAAQAAASAAAQCRRHLLAVLATNGEVSLEYFAGLPSQAAAVLLNAIEIALGQYRPSRGSGQAVIDDAGLQVTVRPGLPRTTVTVELAEGRLTGPDLRVSVVPADKSPDVPRQATPDTAESTWSIA